MPVKLKKSLKLNPKIKLGKVKDNKIKDQKIEIKQKSS